MYPWYIFVELWSKFVNAESEGGADSLAYFLLFNLIEWCIMGSMVIDCTREVHIQVSEFDSIQQANLWREKGSVQATAELISAL